MGRPLKIKQSTTKDIGFNNFGNLTVPVIPTGITTTEYLGVTGGGWNGGIATATYPTVAISANITGATTASAYIITQKGQIKYLVATNNTINDGSFVVGQSYIIKALGTTNWTPIIGTNNNPQVGTIFTALTVGGSGSGTVSSVGQCTLVANATPTIGQMNMTFNVNGGTSYATQLTNKYIWDNSIPATRYAVNFFVAGETTAVTLGSVAVANTAGWFTANASTFTTGQIINVSGAFTGNATITDYTNPTLYYVIDTNGTTTFQLSTAEGAANIITVAGNTRGLTFTEATATTLKSGAAPVTWTNTTGALTLAQVQNYTS